MDIKAMILHTSLYLLIILFPQNTSSSAHPLTQHPWEKQKWGVQERESEAAVGHTAADPDWILSSVTNFAPLGKQLSI